MAILNQNYATLLDYANRVDPDGSAPVIVEMLNQVNPMLEEMPFINGNLSTGHKTTIRTGLPQGTWRRLYGGVSPTKSTTDQVTESVGNLEAYMKIDKQIVDLAQDGDAFRTSEASAFMEGMSQQIATTLFYEDTDINPDRFMGLAPRFNTGDETAAKNAVNVIDAGGTGADNTSIWVIGWGDKKCCGILPKDSGDEGAIVHRDLGEDTDTAPDGSGEYQIYRDHFKITMGLAVEDWRYVVRICNIDVSALQADPADGGADLFLLISQAMERLHMETDRTRIYANRTITAKMREQQIRQKTVRIQTDMAEGRKVTHLDGTVISRSDALINTEAAVTGF